MRRDVMKNLPGKKKIRLLKKHFLEKKTISELCESAQVNLNHCAATITGITFEKA